MPEELGADSIKVAAHECFAPSLVGDAPKYAPVECFQHKEEQRMQKYTDVVTSARSGAAIPNARVTVKTYPGAVLATIYSDDGITTQTNPLTTDPNGEFSFYAADGRYQLTVSGTGITERTVTDVLLADPDDGTEEQSAADVTFTPSGSGSVAGTVQGQLRKFVFRSDYSSAANFNTATDALNGGTIGLPSNVRFAPWDTGTLGNRSITWVTGNADRADFHLSFGESDNNGDRNIAIRLGYNVDSGAGKVVSGEPSMAFVIESDWNDGSRNLVEVHVDGFAIDDEHLRPWSFLINRSTNAIDHIISCDTVSFFDAYTGGHQAFKFTLTSTTGVLEIYSGSNFTKMTNNEGWLYQRNALGSASVEFMRLNASDKIWLAPNGNADIFTNGKFAVGGGPDTTYPMMVTSTVQQCLRLHSVSTATNPTLANPTILLRNTSATAGNFSSIGFLAAAAAVYGAMISGHIDTQGASADGSLRFFTASGGTLAEKVRIDKDGNVGIGTSTFGTNAVQVLGIETGTAPSVGVADTVQFYSSDISAGNTMPSFYCEGTGVIATGQADSASSVRVKMRINGTEVTLLAI